MRVESKNYSLRIVIVGIVSAIIALILTWLYNSNLIEKLCYWFITNNLSLFLPLIIGVSIVQITILLSPSQKKWSRIIIVFTSLFLMIRYFWWRSTSTLNLSDSVNSIFSIGLLLIEIALILSPFLQTILTLNIKSRKSQADRVEEIVKQKIYQPTVDILIPSYNEPLEVVKRTIVGCQSIEYNDKKIYLLDDGYRQEIQQLCKELNCNYIARENRLHAKAGNLNYALSQTKGELIAVFDADFVPTTNFLTRSIGFFQDPKIGLLQTYQSFYSNDPIAKNLGLEDKIPPDVDIFSRYYQPIRDSINTALCYGSSFVISRKSLEKIGGFITNSLSEDYHTGIRLSAENYQVIYLAESLSAGLSAENIFGYIRQRQRWARGTIQTLFINENPLFIKNFKWWQKIAHLEGILQWFSSPLKVILLLLPLAYNLFHLMPLQTNFEEIIYFFFPFYFVQMLIFSWLNFRSRSILMSEVYNVVTAVPITIEILQTLINPFQSIFKVTPKGIKNNSYYFNWKLASPLIFFLVINLFNFLNLVQQWINDNALEIVSSIDLKIVIFWNFYNLLLIMLSIIALIERPKPDSYQWLKVNKPVILKNGNQIYQGIVTKMSEIGVEINFNSSVKIPNNGELEFLMEELSLPFKSISYLRKKDTIKVIFSPLSLSQYRQVIKILFCQPNTWIHQQTPKELQSLWLLIKALFRISLTPLNIVKTRFLFFSRN
ncbi:glycosyltransferase [Geminocystis sp. CENA526]|uniref:glycosyltransferase family 2 protein n=1 Tax=Geminocystis sp. CENA526 TaxID=1355871 RepID=UPI003D6FCFDB